MFEQIAYGLVSALLDYLRRRGFTIDEIPSFADLDRDRRARQWVRDHTGQTGPDSHP